MGSTTVPLTFWGLVSTSIFGVSAPCQMVCGLALEGMPDVESIHSLSGGKSMQSINWRRVILGGLLAGLVINVFESVLNGAVLAKDWEAAMAALGKPPMGGSQVAVFVIWGFLVGIFAVWLYAAIRPRYGAGPKTALCAGAAVWALGYLLASAAPIVLNLFPARVIVIGLVVGLVEVLVGTLLGAWLYRETGTV
jgi:hypothetical protein